MSNITALMKKPIQLAEMSNDELIREFRTCLSLTVDSLKYLATIIREMRKRRLSIPESNSGFMRQLIAVADRQLEAELVVSLADCPAKIEYFKGVPKKLQINISKGAKFPVVEDCQDRPEGVAVVERTVRQMTSAQIQQVFTADGVRTAEEQKKHRVVAVNKAVKRRHRSAGRASQSKLRVEADPTKGDLIIGAYRLKPHELTKALKTLGFKMQRVK